MKLGVNCSPEGGAGLVEEAERLGYDVAFVPEGYRSDAVSLLGVLAARTTRIGLASGVLQIPARSAAMTAMTVATLDALSQGRFRLGLGVSNAYISEAWHGVPFARPLRRTREYVELVRRALRREPMTLDGDCLTVPLPGAQGAPFQHLGPPVRADIPIYLAAVGPRSLRLCGEIADGWFGVFCSPARVTRARTLLAEGRQGGDLDGFEVMVSIPISVADDPRVAAGPIAGYIARFVALGPAGGNFYHGLMCAMGYQQAADDVHALAGRGDFAAARSAVPFEFIDETALVGPAGRIAGRLARYADAGVTTAALSPFGATPADRMRALTVAAEAAQLTAVLETQ
ncbi:LLM class flavin-dependent oxidoreductase [Actinoplanes sp. N902-109]|uniref:LLM class flavin-dependent oxidoreductase n=1 Tax=Actinoplanes sp. (strain N902-109) TaxID=649831 RepID=UPI000329569C|nr:LLM class flavin-dependent oxidoreductase [Actinoplanes sp. N902-109]AGL16626.1 Luciferase-like monooxygenase [Actinoplanes sp. N902-109]